MECLSFMALVLQSCCANNRTMRQLTRDLNSRHKISFQSFFFSLKRPILMNLKVKTECTMVML